MTYGKRTRTASPRIRGLLVAGILGVVAAVAAFLGYQSPASSAHQPTPSAAGPSSVTAALPGDVLRREQRVAAGRTPPCCAPGTSADRAAVASVPASVWPADGQAAFIRTGLSQVQASPNQHPVPIASIAKVMTAYLVLGDHPLRSRQDGPTVTFSAADVADTERRREQQQSVISIAAGEHLTERQALQALLLPSANNVAVVLARWDAGSVEQFVARMNNTARSLGMTHTHYTDPSGYDEATVSTATDQVRIVDAAMRVPAFAGIVATRSASLPVAGTVYNTDTLLGHDGFIGVKTGSDDAAGGCFAFRAIRWIDGKRRTITGVVLGQSGHNLIAAGLASADVMVARIASR